MDPAGPRPNGRAPFLLYAEHVGQLGGTSPLHNVMDDVPTGIFQEPLIRTFIEEGLVNFLQ